MMLEMEKRMDLRESAAVIIDGRAGGHIMDLATRLIYMDRLREPLIRFAGRGLDRYLERRDGGSESCPRINLEHRLTAAAIVDTVDRLVKRRAISPHVLRVIMELWGRALALPTEARPAVRRFREERGCEPPWFLAVSPGHACNLNCAGCYSTSDGDRASLQWTVLDRVVTEARELWGINLVVLSGGEPLAYRSEGRDVLDLVERHPECLFLMFTNGTLIDRAAARRLERLGNLTPALSVEGMRESTDAVRGSGVFDRVVAAMDLLREEGVPVGISLTAARDNCEEILSDDFIEFFFGAHDAFYGFIFQYMPMGRNRNLRMMPTPEQRLELWRRSWEVVEERKAFLFDFWNYGTMVHGCVAAGRERGYMHVDWNGKVMPCVFVPYSAGNINEVYAGGGDLNDIWESPFFKAIRRWQMARGYGSGAPKADGNWITPCPIRDHYPQFKVLLERYAAEPQDEYAALALDDALLQRGLRDYGEEIRELSLPLWRDEYLGR